MADSTDNLLRKKYDAAAKAESDAFLVADKTHRGWEKYAAARKVLEEVSAECRTHMLTIVGEHDYNCP